jgi:hypothetical protein
MAWLRAGLGWAVRKPRRSHTHGEQGNGNAVLLEHEHRAFTFSMQCRENLFSKEQHSDLDVYLQAGEQPPRSL